MLFHAVFYRFKVLLFKNVRLQSKDVSALKTPLLPKKLFWLLMNFRQAGFSQFRRDIFRHKNHVAHSFF